MIDAAYYHSIYLFFVTVITFLLCNNICKQNTNLNKKESIFVGIIIVLVLSFFIGLRPYSPYFGDSQAYFNTYYRKVFDYYHVFFEKNSLIFSNLLSFFASYHLGCSSFFILISLLYFGCSYLSCSKFFPQKSVFAFLVYLGAFSTYAYSVNGIRAGVAASIFYCAIAYREKKWLSILLLLISWGFHHSMHVSILAFIVVYYYSEPKVYVYFWLACLLISVFHISYFQIIFSRLTDEKGAVYLFNSTLDKAISIGRMRYDFVLYSAIPIVIGYYIYNKLEQKIKEYDFILCLYILLNSLWMLCMYAAFTNRIAYLSWQLYPFVLGYPFLSEKVKLDKMPYPKKKMLVLVTMLHLGFTLFMSFVYYA